VANATGFRSITGRGVEADVDGRPYAVGGPALLRERSLAEPPELAEWSGGWKARGAAVLYLVRSDEIVGGLALEDEVRPEARAAVTQLQSMGRQVVMITGDARQVADAVGADLAVDEVFAEVLPEDKAAKVTELQDRGLSVAMVGDGVNDAPALAGADVGVAMGVAGSDVALETADIALMADDLSKLPTLVRMARKAEAIIRANIAFALATKVAFVALGLLGYATLWMAVLADMGASLLVVTNGLRALRP
jgi:Cu2+-exporting ATPase